MFLGGSISNSKIEKLNTDFTKTGAGLGNFAIRDTFIGDTEFIDCFFVDSLFENINSFARDLRYKYLDFNKYLSIILYYICIMKYIGEPIL